MKTIEVKVSRIGNSKGIRLPAAILEKYGMSDAILLEQRPDEIVLRTKHRKKLSWKQTFAEMAAARENWSEFDQTVGDGLDEN